MVTLNTLAPYSDANGNKILYEGREIPGVRVEFSGSNNTMEVLSDVRLAKLNVVFDCDNGTFRMAGNKFGAFSGFIRVGQDSTVSLGHDVTATNACVISAVEGTSVIIGNDVMLASENEIRADDGHAIFDVESETRVNWSKNITIGDHVWVAKRAVLLGGASIGDGSVVGFGSIVTGTVPNNCVAAGVPAKVIRQNIAWERPHLSRAKPFYKPHAGTVKKSSFWNKTEDSMINDPKFVAVYDFEDQIIAVTFASEAQAKLWSEDHCNGKARITEVLHADAAEKLISQLSAN
ncbi:acyltransferase [Arthrobacter sp. ZGTC212]|uniref:acyltransferase n=1 Tax=Arthrobacter sp. ZGTC212 TaxID=2058899 RepID=UPI000CE50685|nr:acyltransferase [Arthrobacter sp. ZGTC212]